MISWSLLVNLWFVSIGSMKEFVDQRLAFYKARKKSLIEGDPEVKKPSRNWQWHQKLRVFLKARLTLSSLSFKKILVKALRKASRTARPRKTEFTLTAKRLMVPVPSAAYLVLLSLITTNVVTTNQQCKQSEPPGHFRFHTGSTSKQSFGKHPGCATDSAFRGHCFVVTVG